MNLDPGSLASCSYEVQTKVFIGDFGFGSLGTAIYGGVTVGSIKSMKELGNIGSKRNLLAFSMMINSICIFLFTVSTNIYLLLVLRFTSGLFQAVFLIYGPVWADAYAPNRLKTSWVSSCLLTRPLGHCLGFFATGFLTKAYNWELSFQIMAVLVAISAIAILLVPHKYLDCHLANKHKFECALNVKYDLKPPEALVARDLEHLSLLSDNDKQERKPVGSDSADETINRGGGEDSMIRDENDSMLSDFSLKESMFIFWENTEF